jgi:hypothetical protein
MTADELQALYEKAQDRSADAEVRGIRHSVFEVSLTDEWPSLYRKLKAAETLALFADHYPHCTAYGGAPEYCTCNLTEALREWEEANGS